MTDEKTRLFIATHRHEDVRQLALKASRHTDVDMTAALCQIAGWQAARQKNPHMGSHRRHRLSTTFVDGAMLIGTYCTI